MNLKVEEPSIKRFGGGGGGSPLTEKKIGNHGDTTIIIVKFIL